MKKLLTLYMVLILTIFLACCGQNESGNQFVGKWDNIDPDNYNCLPGDPTSIIIYKDGDLFIIDVIHWSENGTKCGKVYQKKAYTATFKDGSLEISDGFGKSIDFGTSSGHIFFRKFEFAKDKTELNNQNATNELDILLGSWISLDGQFSMQIYKDEDEYRVGGFDSNNLDNNPNQVLEKTVIYISEGFFGLNFCNVYKGGDGNVTDGARYKKDEDQIWVGKNSMPIKFKRRNLNE